MEALKHHQWSISIHAKAKGVGFKLKAFRILHRSRLSFILRVPGFPLYLKSRTELAREGSGKTRFLRFLRRIFRWKPKNVAEKKEVLCAKGSKVGKPERSGFQFPLQDPVAIMLGSLSLLLHSASKRDHEGIFIHGLTFLFYLIMLLTFKMKKMHFPLVLAITIISTIGISCICLSYWGFFTVIAWKTGMNAITVWFLFSLSQVVFSRILPPTQTKPLRWITFLAPMLIWICEPRDQQAGRLYASSATILAKCKRDLFLMLKEVCRGFKEELFSI